MFADLGLKYVGPIDAHDIPVERALQQAKQFRGPVLVHCITRKGNGFKAAENHEEDRFHAVGKINAKTGEVGAAWADLDRPVLRGASAGWAATTSESHHGTRRPSRPASFAKGSPIAASTSA